MNSVFIILLSLGTLCFADSLQPDLKTFHSKVKPLLEKYCIDCHGPKKIKGKVRYDNIDPDIVKGRNSTVWHDTYETFNIGEMPPEDEKQPSNEEREIIRLWLDQEFKKAKLAGNPNKSGIVRRLTKYELTYTLEDLLNISVEKALQDLPEEAASDHTGLKNSSSLLMVSDTYLQTYFNAIFNVFDKIKAAASNEKYSVVLDIAKVVIPKPKELPEYIKKLSGKPRQNAIKQLPKGPPELFKGLSKEDNGLLLEREGYASLMLPKIPKSYYQINISSKKSKAAFEVFIGTKNPKTKEEFLEKIATVPSGKTSLNFHVDNLSLGITAAEGLDFFIRVVNRTRVPALLEGLSFVGNINDETKKQLVSYSESEDVNNNIKAFATKALRREITADEEAKLLAKFNTFSKSESKYVALASVYESILCDPDFLFLGTRSKFSENKSLNFIIAEKLSYFLWCTIPDDALIKDASAGRLTDKAVLTKHVERMLQDKRSRRFVETFTDQWLHTGELENVVVDSLHYPSFRDSLKVFMRQETIEAVNDVLRMGAPALDLLDAEHVFVNKELAKYYGVSSGKGNEFSKVKLGPDSKRGGLLTQGTFLIINSDGIHSHAIKRGVWLNEILLNDPPPKAPNDVPPFDETIPGFEKMTLNQKLAAHRNNAACRSCHNKIDPWGVLFENFDAAGQWRDKVTATAETAKNSNRKQGEPKRITLKTYLAVETEAAIPGNIKLKNMEELKKHIVKNRKEDFARGMTEKLLSYALSRDVDFYDAELVKELNKKFMAENFSAVNLIKNIVSTDNFMKGAAK